MVSSGGWGPQPHWTAGAAPGPPWPGPPPGPPPVGGRWVWIVVGAVVAVTGLVAGVVVAVVGQQQAPPDVAVPVVADALVGDPRTADPCGLLDDEVLGRFGAVTRYPDFGVLSSCDLQITVGTERIVVDAFLLSLDEVGTVRGARDEVGPLAMLRPPPSDTRCSRVIDRGEAVGVQIDVTRSAAGAADLCAMAEAATSWAALVVASGAELPRRVFRAPTDRLADLDTCSLLDDVDLGVVPDLDDGRRVSWFGGWGCVWGDTDTGPWARVHLTRSGPPPAGIGTPVTLAGRPALLTEATDTYCEVRIVVAAYTGSTGNDREDVVIVTLSAVSDPCNRASRLAEATIPRLPG